MEEKRVSTALPGRGGLTGRRRKDKRTEEVGGKKHLIRGYHFTARFLFPEITAA